MFHTLLLRAVALPTILLVLICPSSLAGDEPEDAGTSSDIVEVVAEGAGIDPGDALKDAFRNAVRQVVGTVVDAELLIKNDEIVDDQILTYSDGFVKKYDEVPGSKKSVGGLHRVKIKAQIERRSVMAKLKAAKVTVMDVDGKSLFAEAVTSAEAAENSTKLLAKTLGDLPKVMSASVVGKPEYDRDKGELVVNVQVEVDAAAYREFSTILEHTLSKIAISKVTAQIKAVPIMDLKSYRNDAQSRPNVLVVTEPAAIMGPTIKETKNTTWCFWVLVSSTGGDRSQLWNGYVLDADLHTTALPFMNRHLDRVNGKSWYDDLDLFERILRLAIHLTDANGDVVGAEEAEIVRWESGHRLPWLVLVNPRERTPPYHFFDGKEGFGDVVRFFSAEGKNYVHPFTGEKVPLVANAYLAPFAMRFISAHRATGRSELEILRKQTYQFRIKLTLDELKLVKDAKCSVTYTPASAATK